MRPYGSPSAAEAKVTATKAATSTRSTEAIAETDRFAVCVQAVARRTSARRILWVHMDTSTSVPMSVAQAAARASVSTKTIRRWLSSGRLQATHGPDGAWLIEPADLDRAVTLPGQSTDSPVLHPGHGQVQSIVQELVRTIERQAGELATVRLERDQLAEQMRMRTATRHRRGAAADVGRRLPRLCEEAGLRVLDALGGFSLGRPALNMLDDVRLLLLSARRDIVALCRHTAENRK